MTRSVTLASLVIVMWLSLTAHVGSPNVVFDGSAGPYPVRIIVQPPNAIPGLAEVIAHVSARDARSVTVQPVFWRTGVNGAPEGDVAKRVPGEVAVYSTQVWLMSRGAYSVYVTVTGSRGSGRAIVPVAALATERLGLSSAFGALLVALGLLLFAGLVTIVRAAAGESVVPPGQTIDASAKRRANRIALAATPVIALLLFGGAKWWNAVDAQYRRTMYRPPAVTPEVRGNQLTLRVRDTASFHAIFAPVIPDHGKMMHLFLIQTGTQARFGHFHPVQTDSLVFTTRLARWPRGRYRLFGDILLENGSSQTVTTILDWPGDTAAVPTADPDDSSWPTCCAESGNVAEPARLGQGYLMQWTGGTAPLVAGRSIDLRFDVENEAGEIAHLAPYMGMSAHAVVLSADESVFVHLHPMGTVSADAQQAFLARDRGDSTASGRLRIAQVAMTSPMRMDGRLTIPYEFPRAGRYRVWVQVRPQNATQVLTGAFDFDVR